MDELPRHVIAVFVFIRQGDAILLVRQSYGKRYWSLPGGVVEAGESLDQAAIREVKEETGLDIEIRRVVGLYSKPDEEALAITLEGVVVGGMLSPTTRSQSVATSTATISLSRYANTFASV